MSERARSFWGWGWADRFPDEEARATLGQAVGAQLGFGGLALRPVPRLEDLTLSRPRLEVPPSLAAFATDDDSARAHHAYGKSYRDQLRALSGRYPHPPDLVARPRTEAEIERVLEWCSRESVAVIPFGGGTSVVGGVEADVGGGYAGVVSLDVRGLDRVLELDSLSRTARVQAGATGPDLEAQLRPEGLSLRHFPQSFEFSTLGGWIATRAGGHFATLYTHIDDLVESVRMLTPAGTYATRALPASGAGPSPDRLVIGSEGILGVITEATVRLSPRPRYRAKASVHFARFSDGVAATRAIAQAGLHPANARLLDEREAALNAVTADGSAVLLLAFESADHPLEPWIARAVAIAESFGGRCPGGQVCSNDGDDRGADAGDAAGHWRRAFLDAPYLQSALISLGLVVDTFETACTWSRFDALHGAVIEAVRAAMKRVAGGGRISCRFTHVYPDGPAAYYTFIAPGRAGAELEQWTEIKAAASEALLANGGTITHHHAVGRLHRPWYDRERPDLFARALAAAKAELDPRGILNPGVLIDPRR